MAGSIAQEMGHDLIIMYFIDKVLKPRNKSQKDPKKKEAFFIIHPAMGPEKDIYYWNPKHDEYTSGWDTSRDRYIPEYGLRYKLDKPSLDKLMQESKYWDDEWYKSLSHQLGSDLKEHVDSISNSLESMLKERFPEIDKLPDFVGLNRQGTVISLGEVKAESLAKKALQEILAYQTVADKLGVPSYFIFPKKGVYATLEPKWINENFPTNTQIFTFEELDETGKPKPIIVPNYQKTEFVGWKR